MQNIQLQVAADLANADELLRRDVAELKANEALLEELERLELTEQAARFVDDSTTECPICGTEWPEGHLQQHLATKLAAARNAKLTRDNIQLTAEMIAAPARELKANVTALTDGLRAVGVDPESEDVVALDNWSHSLDDLLKALINPIEQYLDSGLKGEQVATLCKPKSLDDLLNRVVSRIGENLPEPTPGQTAWDKLTRLEESVRALESRIREQQTASRNSERSNILLSEFDKARDLVLRSLYTKIAQRFVDYYSLLHDHERENFSANLRPQRASLNFEVDFLGRGNHPPHALHSEGHQDSMGVCLFLALNEELAVGKPGFFVLDDVVMSVDAGHRKDICRLLNDRFSESQFIITTHDRTWAKQLKQERVVEGPRDIEFTNWTLETGPHTHQQIDLWEGIKSDLARDDVHDAAFKLRRGSEDFFERVCDALGAQVTYNSEMRWQLDDWLGAAQSQYKDLVARALRAASSWSNQEAVETLKEVESVRKQVFDQISIEQWAHQRCGPLQQLGKFVHRGIRGCCRRFQRPTRSLRMLRLRSVFGSSPTQKSPRSGQMPLRESQLEPSWKVRFKGWSGIEKCDDDRHLRSPPGTTLRREAAGMRTARCSHQDDWPETRYAPAPDDRASDEGGREPLPQK